MPRKPLQPCAYPGCPRLCEGRYCEEHRKVEAKCYETYSRDPSVRRKYGRAWKRIRDSYVKTHPFCEQWFERGILVPVDEVHHKVPVSKGGTHERSNLMNSAAYAMLIKLCTDICKKNGKKKLLWFFDKDKSLNYAPKSDEMVLTVHRWFANKSCPGNWLYARLGDLAAKVTTALGGTADSSASGLQAAEFANLTEAQVAAKIGALCREDMKSSGILASVSAAQFIQESGYGKSELAQKANNCFGMKCLLSGNTWSGSAWDGTSKYTKQTQEDDGNGNLYTVTADFRKYPCIEKSVADHSAYLLGAMNGSKKRYDGLGTLFADISLTSGAERVIYSSERK